MDLIHLTEEYMSTGWLVFNVPFQHKNGYIKDKHFNKASFYFGTTSGAQSIVTSI